MEDNSRLTFAPPCLPHCLVESEKRQCFVRIFLHDMRRCRYNADSSSTRCTPVFLFRLYTVCSKHADCTIGLNEANSVQHI